MTTKRRFIKHLPLMLAGLAMGLGVFINDSSLKSNNSIETNASVGNYSTNASTYYNGITASSGKQLAAQLHDLITSTHKTYTTYADNGANLYQTHTDQYYENGNAVSGYIYEFYSGVKWPSAWDANAGSTTGGYNREHCWCQSNSVPSGSSSQLWGENGGGADMHHLRPAENRLNSTRGNDKYGVVSNRDSYKVYAKYGSSTTYHGGYSNSSTFEPLDSKKGDVARIILYVYLHYNTYSNSTLFGSYGTTNGNGSSSYFATSLLPLTNIVKKDTEAQAIQLMLDWNTSDPVDEIEQRRNEQVAIYQGNRNPFIDNSNYANLIWGSGSSSSDPAATISPSTAFVAVGETVSLTATLSNVTSAYSITWESNDSTKATVTKGDTNTTSSVATVTGVSAGSATIYCNYNGTTIGSAPITVTSSGSSQTGDCTFTAGTDVGTMTGANGSQGQDSITKNGVTMSTSNGALAASGQYRVYKDATLTFSCSNSITSIAFSGSSSNSLSNFSTSSGTYSYNSSNYSATWSGNSTSITFTAGAQTRFSPVVVTVSNGAQTKTLSSIAVSTAPTKTNYVVGQTFDPTGLVIRRNYSDSTHDTYTYANHTSEFTFNPTTSTALATSHTSVTISYGGKSCTQAITVSAPVVTSITASVSRTFYVGETISNSDITVKDNNNNTVSSFTFANDGYQFTYADSNSGGATKTKTFTNSVSGAGKTCSLTVNVARAAYVAPSVVSDTITASDLQATTTSYVAFSNVSKSSTAKYAGQTAKNSGAIQMRNTSPSGIVSTTSGGTITSVVITVNNGTNTINVYGKNTAYTSASDLYNNSTQGTLVGSTSSTGTISFTTGYAYVGIRSNSGAVYLTSVQINYGSGQTAKNISNYVMYSDTEGQCTTKLSTTVGYMSGLSSSEKTTLQTSDDYVISTARARLNAWAANQGKVINYSSGTLSNASNVIGFAIPESNNIITLVIIISMVGVSSIGIYLYMRKKKSIN